MELDKVLNVLALFSVPLAIVFCRAWLKSRELELRAAPTRREPVASGVDDADELRRRVEALETIVTSDAWLPGSSRPRVRVVEPASRPVAAPEVEVRLATPRPAGLARAEPGAPR